VPLTLNSLCVHFLGYELVTPRDLFVGQDVDFEISTPYWTIDDDPGLAPMWIAFPGSSRV
jgi:hypothetical protein